MSYLEQLKPFSELLVPDRRSVEFDLYDSEVQEWRRITLQDFYGVIETIRLLPSVPSEVQTHFAAAHNLLAYSWYFYPFNVTAQFLGYVSVEFALRLRYGVGEQGSFKGLVKRAIRDGLVRDEGFSHIARPIERPAPPFMPPPIPSREEDSYVRRLIEALPGLRNHLAHGSSMLHSHGAASVRVAAEFINQLFPTVGVA